MKNTTMPILLGAALLFAGYLVGVTANGSHDGTAYAGPHWDAARGAYVTGDTQTLTIWKVKDGKVLEAHMVTRMGHQLVEATLKNAGPMPMPVPVPMPPAAPVPPPGSNDGAACGSCGGGGSCG